MPTACILRDHSRIHLNSERLEITETDPETGREKVLRSIPIHDLERLIFAENVHISSKALAKILKAQIPVSLLGWNNRFLGSFFPATPAHGQARLQHYQAVLNPDFVTTIARNIIAAKIYNQRRVVQRLDAARRQRIIESGGTPTDATARETVRDLEKYLKALEGATSVDELRGYEGASTARYFRAWATFLPHEAPFERRSTRPPLNAVNSCISFASTLLYQECAACLSAHGLDPALGTLHTTEDGRWSLALDLMEPFRPSLGEALTLDLFSRGMLNPKDHFEPRKGGVYLNDPGRRKFILQYERRMDRQFLSESQGHRTTLRRQLEGQGLKFKAALSDPSLFQAFRMN